MSTSCRSCKHYLDDNTETYFCEEEEDYQDEEVGF